MRLPRKSMRRSYHDRINKASAHGGPALDHSPSVWKSPSGQHSTHPTSTRMARELDLMWYLKAPTDPGLPGTAFTSSA